MVTTFFPSIPLKIFMMIPQMPVSLFVLHGCRSNLKLVPSGVALIYEDFRDFLGWQVLLQVQRYYRLRLTGKEVQSTCNMPDRSRVNPAQRSGLGRRIRHDGQDQKATMMLVA